MRLLALPVLLLAAAGAAAEGGAAPPPAPPPAPKKDDPKAKDYAYYLARARDLATRASAQGDGRIAQEAFDSFLSAAMLRPKDPVPLAEAGLLALETGEPATATRMLNAVYNAAPESAAFHYLRGCLLQGRSDYSDAKAEFQAARGGDFRPDQAEIRFFQCSVGLGLQFGEAFQFDAAVKALEEAIPLRPNDSIVPIAYYNLGVAHRRLQDPKAAEKVFRLCMERFPSYAPTYGELGDMLTELDRFDDAIAVLDRAVKVDPTYSRGWLLKANTQTTRGKFREAEEAFAEYDRRFPRTGLSEFYHGLFHQKRGEPEKAIERLQLALALDPAMGRAVYYLSLCQRDLGNEEKAAAYMEKWKKMEEDIKKKALEHLRQAVDKTGTPPPAEAPPPAGGSDKKKEEGAKDGGGG
jgi:tetratricopeptide (TPR) repeat protein